MIWEFIQGIDQYITLAINNLNGGGLDNVMEFLSEKKVWFPLYAIITIFLVKNLGWKKALIVLVTVVLTIAACDQTSNLFKNGFERLRPCYSLDMVGRGLRMLEDRGNHFGFFSAHAANSFGLAISLIYGFKNDERRKYRGLAAVAILWATMVSASRIFVGKHYFGDVVVGAAVGIMFGILLGIIGRLLIRKYLSRYLA